MNQIVAILGQLVMMLLGYASACLAASGFMHLVWVGPLAVNAHVADLFYTGSMVTVPLLALMIGYFAFFPMLVVLAIAELTGRRGWLFYALAGALVAVPVAGILWIGVTDPEIDMQFLGLSIVGAGMFGGFFYWLVAGRTAGLWRRSRDTEAASVSFGRPAPPA